MAKGLITYANTAGYTFKIYDVGDTASWMPVETTIADWEISYQPQDNLLPGIIPSTFTANFNGGLSMGNWRQILRDAELNYAIEVYEGLSCVWRGFITPDLCSIEVINGLRFVKIVASDGFQVFERKADLYQYSGVISFIEQLYMAMEKTGLTRLFYYIFVSEHWQPKSLQTTDTQGGIWWTGTLQEGHWILNSEYTTFRDAIDQILTTFGLQMFQDKGEIVLRSCHLLTPAWYNMYGLYGYFVARLTPTGLTQTPTIYTDGLELYKPAISEIDLTYNQAPLTDFIGEDTTYRDRSNWFVAFALATGGNHVDFNGTLRAKYTVPANYDERINFYWDVYIQYGNYYWSGSEWLDEVTFVTYTRGVGVTNPDPFPQLGTTDEVITNLHLDDFPTLGWQPIYITVNGYYETTGAELKDFVSQSIYLFKYHNASPDNLKFVTDNTKRTNGVTVSLSSNIGDKPGELVNTPSPGAIRKFSTSARTSTVASDYWDALNNPILLKTVYELNRKSFAPFQYYELDLKGTVGYNHTFNWESVNYKPVNLTITERSTRVTYREWVDGDLETNPNSGRPPFNP